MPENKKDFNKNHPELQSGEKFLCNAGYQGIPTLRERWPDMRIGDHAFSMRGEPLEKNIFPIFVKS